MDKTSYFFIGHETQIGTLQLQKFGTEVKMTPEEAFLAIDGGAQLCPADKFDFTEQEVSLYPYPALRQAAPDAFKVKYKQAVIAVAAHLEDLRARRAQKVVGPNE